jgi:aerobic C4-dicarboxylate transport protein
MSTPIATSEFDATPPLPRGKPFYASLWVQVLIAMVAALVLGYFSPARAIAMKPLGDAFIG